MPRSKPFCLIPGFALTAPLALLLVIGPLGRAQAVDLPDPAVMEAQLAELNADVPGSIWALNPFRNAHEATGDDGTTFRLTSLNPHVNSWFVLEVAPVSGRARAYHLENGDPEATLIALQDGDAPSLVLDQSGVLTECAPWADGSLQAAADLDLPFAPICDWAVFVRNPVRGNRTTREAVSQFLRDNVIFGDSIVNLIKGAFFEDAFMVSSEGFEGEVEISGVELLGTALLAQTPAMRPAMGFELEGTDGGAMTAGAWYEVTDAPGIYASVMQPAMIAREVFDVPGANGLDGVENRADVYLVAFDMAQFEIGYEVGTDHPALGWSPRPSGAGRHYQGPGPDGIDRPDPLVFNGMLSPNFYETVAATFTGGFKREHGAWRFGDYASFNWGHHYGFLTHGVLFSRLWPNLATLYVLEDGTVGMRTWTEEDAGLMDRLVTARQNGVPLIENGVPGDRVTSWGGGNWSGSAEANLRTLRAGACLRTVEGRQFLIYAYFSSATPSGMARTFQAYQCDYAMLLDMNSQELTYMALYTREDGDLETRHLVRGMAESDPSGAARFVEAPDNRDFFYLVRRE
ncbi:hypothetical protein [Roseicyclus mahoneyensis]|uniref:Uncharacterized protein n=1 Tax=Roseicyclus mahoneyensis TaxID=164332 RepID=A0A316GAU9_9RHOB|nr:hypothetical protein [Roseicyclus mahoneyensis]PWK58089.1 hypothetical protein C7455_11030 [Roseicyclus mahoneyensis]